MFGVTRAFLGASIVYGIIGMLIGLSMAISHDHAAMPAHAHIMVLGWLSFAVFAMVYHVFPAAGQSLWAKLHAWAAIISSAVMLTGVYLIYAGYPAADPVAAAGSIAYALSFLLFVLAAWPLLAVSPITPVQQRH